MENNKRRRRCSETKRLNDEAACGLARSDLFAEELDAFLERHSSPWSFNYRREIIVEMVAIISGGSKECVFTQCAHRGSGRPEFLVSKNVGTQERRPRGGVLTEAVLAG